MKAVKAAIEAKNRFHHDFIFRGVVLSNVSIPEWLDIKITPQEIEAKKQTVIKDRMAKLPAFDVEVAKTLALKANTFDIVPVK